MAKKQQSVTAALDGEFIVRNGKYKGVAIKDVPLAYIEFMFDNLADADLIEKSLKATIAEELAKTEEKTDEAAPSEETDDKVAPAE